MRELVYTGFTSLDGVVDSPGGPEEGHRSGGWVFKDLEFVPEAWTIKGEELGETTALKRDGEGAIFVHGSAELARGLSDAGLIDRYHLLVFPVLLGAGKRLFSATDKDKQSLKVVESETYGNGIQKLVYDVIH